MARTAMVVWRIARKTPHSRATDMSGRGAKSIDARWNRKGTAAVYASTHISLAMLETLVHTGGSAELRNAFLIGISVPSMVWAARESIAPTLPISWMAQPPGATSIEFGDKWLKANSAAILMVPSAIVPEEQNVVINPSHPHAQKLTAVVVR
jgi:RES domain-containing protein